MPEPQPIERDILVVTHGGVADELVAIARDLLGSAPGLDSISVASKDSLDTLFGKIQKWAKKIPKGARGVILTDLKNSSATVAALSLAKSHPIDCVCGVNLPMLLRALSPSVRTVEEIMEAGRAGIDRVGPKR